MTIRRLGSGTQHQYIRHVKSFADFVGRSPDKTTPEDVRRYQLRLASIGTTVPTLNAGASALRFFFRVTLKRRNLAEAVVSVREPRRRGVTGLRQNRLFREVFSKAGEFEPQSGGCPRAGVKRYSRSHDDLPQWGGLTDAAGSVRLKSDTKR